MTDFAERVIYARALLAATDPEGERDAVAPLSPVRSRQILLEYHERRSNPQRAANNGDDTDLLERLGADLSRQRGRVPCPAHGGRDRNLAWALTADGRALLHCFSHQCEFEDIVAAVR
jgi:hypothetical protein